MGERVGGKEKMEGKGWRKGTCQGEGGGVGGKGNEKGKVRGGKERERTRR